MGGMRRSEVSALRWADVDDTADGDGALVTVRRGKTNQEGETRDVRFVKGGVAPALQTLRAAASPAPEDRVVPLSPKMVGLRFQAAARAAGVEHVTAHSGRVGAGVGVAHYSAGATAECLWGPSEVRKVARDIRGPCPGPFAGGARSSSALRRRERVPRSPGPSTYSAGATFGGQRAPRLKVTASKGRMRTGASSCAVAISTHSPSRSSKASRVRSAGSTSHR